MRFSNWPVRRWLIATALGVIPVLAGAAPPTGEIIRAHEPSQRGGYDLRSALQLGGAEAPDEQQFYERYEQIRVDADGAGNIYVLDGGNVRVQVFDSEGRWLRSIGGEGEGPGEFKMPARLSVNAGGQCAVFDMATMRVSVFEASGELAQDVVPGRPVVDLHLRDDGTLLCALMMPGGVRVVAWDGRGAELWSYGDGEAPTGGRILNIENGADHMSTRLCELGDGRVLLTSKDEYWLRVIHEGTAQKTFQRPFERREFEMPQRDGDDEGEGGMEVVMIRRGDGGDGDSPGRVEVQAGDHDDVMTFNGQELRNMMPKFSPDLRGSLAWHDGRIWALTSETDGDRIIVDEWSRDGKYVRRFGLTRQYDWYEVGADGKLYAIAHDVDDYPIVHRLDITTLE